MKAVILAGGFGTRLSEETVGKPKPMVEIGGKPIIWHIMKIYSAYGINEFIICCGYKGYMIKEYFSNYFYHNSDLTIQLAENETIVHKKPNENWKVTVVDTGEKTMTGGRLRRIREFLDDDKPFCFTYGDGLANVNISELISFHEKNKKLATLTATYPPARFGALKIEDENILAFEEKPKGDGVLVNGGFFVLEKSVIDLIEDDSTIWEQGPLKSLAANRELKAFKHFEFWQPMDTLKDKMFLEDLWAQNKAPWKVW